MRRHTIFASPNLLNSDPPQYSNCVFFFYNTYKLPSYTKYGMLNTLLKGLFEEFKAQAGGTN